ncbi:hypothetical protein [Proteiniborus sp. MB09-C3]|uniref:hypothetical protein n=1 Tax=Proteiniborus sp. MB09-C3 TaxID=3050072 RepID=UPI00255467F4|nr:hypothetical protein [Proteiniborus sp. MB09-C3]WIV11871.1 hypothetical protein QO263_17490 [Proteiniborus sp. MB09-C3]
MHQQVLRVMIESAVDQGLYGLKTDLKRTVRNLTDLGSYFAKGRFQKDFFEIAQKMLANENSPYYELVSNIVNNVDHHIIKNFGINIGLNSWTNGAKKIREYEKKNGYNIPWTIVFDFQNKVQNPLTVPEIIEIINEGKEMGIYSYFFFTSYEAAHIDELLEIFDQNRDCAFIIYTSYDSLSEKHIYKLREYGNVIVSIAMDEFNLCPGFVQTMELLLKNKCLFGIHINYDDNNVDIILSDSWIEQIRELHCTFAFLIKAKDCSPTKEKEIISYVRNGKTNQKYPIFLIDFYEDIEHVDVVISTEPCFFKILQDGTVVSSKENIVTNFEIRNTTLCETLPHVTPKVGY